MNKKALELANENRYNAIEKMFRSYLIDRKLDLTLSNKTFTFKPLDIKGIVEFSKYAVPTNKKVRVIKSKTIDIFCITNSNFNQFGGKEDMTIYIGFIEDFNIRDFLKRYKK
jgi:hypothetical protein